MHDVVANNEVHLISIKYRITYMICEQQRNLIHFFAGIFSFPQIGHIDVFLIYFFSTSATRKQRDKQTVCALQCNIVFCCRRCEFRGMHLFFIPSRCSCCSLLILVCLLPEYVSATPVCIGKRIINSAAPSMPLYRLIFNEAAAKQNYEWNCLCIFNSQQ